MLKFVVRKSREGYIHIYEQDGRVLFQALVSNRVAMASAYCVLDTQIHLQAADQEPFDQRIPLEVFQG